MFHLDDEISEDSPYKSGVTFLTWVVRNGSLPNILEYNIYDDTNIFTTRPMCSGNYKSQYIEDESMRYLGEVQEQLNMLICGYGNGNIHLSVFGKFPFCTINLQELLNDEYGDYEVVNIELSDDFSVMQVYYLDKPSKNIFGATLNTSVLSAYSDEVFIVGNRYVQIIHLLKSLSHTMDSITESSENIILEMDTKMANYATSVPQGAVSADFLELLMMGTPSEELEIFLLQELTTKGLKKFGNSVELSYSTIQKLVLKQLNVVAQSLAYNLSELRGLSRIPDRYKLLGLNEKTITEAISSSYAFLNKCLEMQQVIDISMRNYKAFFRWLYGVILRLQDDQAPTEIVKITQQDLTHIAEFLYNFDSYSKLDRMKPREIKPAKFNLERLSQYLKDQELTILPDNEDNPWQRFLKENPCLFKENETLFSVAQFRKFSLVQQQNHLKLAINNVFKESGKEFGLHFSLLHHFKCYEMKSSGKALHNFRLTQIYDAAQGTFMMCLLNSNLKRDGFCFMSINVNSKDNDSTAVKFHFANITEDEDEEYLEIMDIQFYSTEYISVLVKHAHREECTLFVQFPVKLALENSQSLNIKSKLCIFHDKMPKVNVSPLLDQGGYFRIMDKLDGYRIGVSGGRKVAIVLAESKRKVRLFEMVDAEDEEEDEEEDEKSADAHDSIEDSAHNQGVTF